MDCISSIIGYFNPRPPCGGRPCQYSPPPYCVEFQSAPSLRRATPVCPPLQGRTSFQSAPSLRRATQVASPLTCAFCEFQSAPSLRRATNSLFQFRLAGLISIRALLAEGDGPAGSKPANHDLFQSAPSLRRATPSRNRVRTIHVIFQSAPSLRRATRRAFAYEIHHTHFNPRPPCGGRLHPSHPPAHSTYFNPRPPCGGRLKDAFGHKYATEISIRALLAEGDPKRKRLLATYTQFQSAPSLRRATSGATRTSVHGSISIRALLAEGDVGRGRALACRAISIRALLAEGDDFATFIKSPKVDISIRALLAEGDADVWR